MFKYFYLLFLSLNVLLSFSQDRSLSFRHLTIADGLSYSSVHVSFQDKDGFMWFGTDLGLNKFDGNTFTIYKHDESDSCSLSENFVINIFEDSYSKFWIATAYSGLNTFDRHKEAFKRYQYRPGEKGCLSSNNVRDVFEDSKNNLWVTTAGGGVNIFNRQSDSFYKLPFDSTGRKGLVSNFINSVDEDSKGNLWFGSTEGVLSKYNPVSKKFEHFKLYGDYVGAKYDKSYCKIYIDSNDNVWFGTEIGLFFYNASLSAIEHYHSNSEKFRLNVNAISSVFELMEDVFLVATDHGGVNIIDKNTGKVEYLLSDKNDPKSLINNQLHEIYQSPDGIIWIGSYKGGVNYFDPKPSRFKKLIDLLPPDKKKTCCEPVLTIAEDVNRNIWIGYDGYGGEVYHPDNGKIEPLAEYLNVNETLLPNIIISYYRDRLGHMWIGSFMNGLQKINCKTMQIEKYVHDSEDRNSISGNSIRGVLEDSNGDIWIGTIGEGLNLFNKDDKKFSRYYYDENDVTSISNNYIDKIFEDKNRTLWIGTRRGLNKYNSGNRNFTRYLSDPLNRNSITGNRIHSIIEDIKGHMWIGTDEGLNLFDVDSDVFIHVLGQEEMQASAVYSIIEDDHNNLWLSTNRGLKKYSYITQTLTEFSLNDGLQGLEFNLGFCKGEDGTFYFSGANGFNFFQPEEIGIDSVIKPIFITSFKIFHEKVSHKTSRQVIKKHVNFANEIKIRYGQSIISFEFTSLDYMDDKRVKFAYKLNGFNEEWNYIGTRREVTFTNLDPGEYEFFVKASNKDGVWSEKGTSIRLIVLPPFHKTLWFRMLGVFILVFSIIVYIMFRERNLKWHKKVLEKRVGERTLEIELINEELVKQNIEVINVNEKLNVQKNELKSTIEELKSTQGQLIHAEKMASLGVLTAGIAHEINNPINFVYVGIQSLEQSFDLIKEFISEYEQLLEENLPTEAQEKLNELKKLKYFEENYQIIPTLIESVKTGALRTEEIVKGLRNFSRFNEDEFELIDIHEGIESSILLLSNKLKGRVVLTKQYSTEKLYLNCYAGQINQVIMNLLSNAIDSIESKGEIVISTQSIDEFHPEFSILDVKCIKLSIKDTGTGIDDNIKEKIFLPFYTTKQVGQGTGLGLSISYGIVEKHRGKIRVLSSAGNGAEFQVFLPVGEFGEITK